MREPGLCGGGRWKEVEGLLLGEGVGKREPEKEAA